MGFEVVTIGRGQEKAELATKLGAHHYVDTKETDAGKALGGAMVVVNTASVSSVAAAASKGLKPGGAMIVLGVTEDPISVASLDLAFQNWNFTGALTGLPAIGDETLKFSVLTPVAPMIEKMPLERAPEAYDRRIKGDASFRIVLTMGA